MQWEQEAFFKLANDSLTTQQQITAVATKASTTKATMKDLHALLIAKL